MRRIAGLTVTGLGAFLVTFGLLLRFWVPGQAIKFPLNEYSVTTLTGTHITYFSTGSLKEYTGVSVTATQTIDGDVKSGSRDIAVWGSFTAVQDTTDQTSIENLTQRSAFGRRSGLLLNCCAATVGASSRVRQAGLGFRWPFGAAHRTYQLFDVTLLRPVPVRYEGTGTVDGMTADKFVEHVGGRQFGRQTLPGPLVGMKQQATVTLPEYLTATDTFWVDPVTGTVLDRTQDQTISLRDSSGVTRLVLFGGTLKETAGSVRAAVAAAARSHPLIEWTQVFGPLIGLLAGLAALAVGIAVVWRSPRSAEPGYDDELRD